MGLLKKIKSWAQSDQVASAAEAAGTAAVVDLLDLELADDQVAPAPAPAPASSLPTWAVPVGVGVAALLVGVAVARR